MSNPAPAPPNPQGQPIGFDLSGWSPPPHPPHAAMAGRFCRLEPLRPEEHAAELYANLKLDERNWTYLPYGPFDHFEDFQLWLASVSRGGDPQFFTVFFADGAGSNEEAAGLASFLRIKPEAGSIEVGHIHFSNRLQNTAAATEAMYLMMARAFDLGYRRYEWKCDALNARSRAAAQRLGLSFEGVFRQATVYKNRNRDTAWYAAIDSDWPALGEAFARWLDPSNFDGRGSQQLSLRQLTRPVLGKLG